ncbi:MAG: DUF433 domain-containing protein [Myxococcota bacterium]
MNRFPRITIDERILNGQPCIRGMRLSVRRVLQILAEYDDRKHLRQDYPELENEDIEQALAYAAARLEDRVVPLRAAG